MQHFSIRSSVGIPSEKLAELRELSPNAAIFTSLPSSERDKPAASDYDTVTAEGNEDSLLPEPLTSLLDYNAINMEGVLLQEFAVKKFSDYESCFSQDLYDRLTAITIFNIIIHRVSQMCGDYIEKLGLLHQISMMSSIVNLAKVKLYSTN